MDLTIAVTFETKPDGAWCTGHCPECGQFLEKTISQKEYRRKEPVIYYGHKCSAMLGPPANDAMQ